MSTPLNCLALLRMTNGGTPRAETPILEGFLIAEMNKFQGGLTEVLSVEWMWTLGLSLHQESTFASPEIDNNLFWPVGAAQVHDVQVCK
jgi:hypothetical protein